MMNNRPVWKHRLSTPSGPLPCSTFNFYHNLLKQGTGTADHLTLLRLLLVVFPAPQSTSFQTSSASACLISCRFLCFFLIFSLWLRYLTAVRAAHGWHDYCVNPPQYVIYRPLCLIRECPAVASLEFYFHFFYRIFLRKRKLSSAYWRKSPNYAM